MARAGVAVVTRREVRRDAKRRRRAVVKAYGDGTKNSFADIAETMGVSRQRVQALHAQARALGEIKGAAGGAEAP